MDLQDLLKSALAEQEEDNAIEELNEELVLFDLKEDKAESSDDDAMEEQEDQKEIALAPPGIPFFKNNMYCLYTQGTLVWPEPPDIVDNFLSLIDRSLMEECILKGFFLRQVNSTSLLVKYLLHTLCCTTDEDLRHAAYNSLVYAITGRPQLTYIMDELYLALVNMGGDLSILKRDVMSYKSIVIPESCSTLEDEYIDEKQLRNMLLPLLRFLSQCLERHSLTSKEAEELLLILIAISLDPKVIDSAFDNHISTCISHAVNQYSDTEFSLNLKSIVERVLEYCSSDVTSVVYVCQSCFIPVSRGKALRSALAFHQLKRHLKLPDDDFVADVKIKNISDLLTSYFQGLSVIEEAYESYYIFKLIDLCIHPELVNNGQETYLKVIFDLIEERFMRSRFGVNNMNPTITLQYQSATVSKWKRLLSSHKIML